MFARDEGIGGGHDELFAHVLVVGGTGILRPAVDRFARQGCRVTVVARRALDKPPEVFAARVDVRDSRALEAALDGTTEARGSFDAALVYAPSAPVSSVEAIAQSVPGRLVYILTSEWSAPGADRAERDARTPAGAGGPGLTQRVTLGWTRGPEGARWHTPEEVSRGTLVALERGASAFTVGTLRPWSERPSA